MTPVSNEVKESFLSETKELVSQIIQGGQKKKYILMRLSLMKDCARILSLAPIGKLFGALESIYKALCDKTIIWSENLARLIMLVCKKINECCDMLERSDEDFEDEDVSLYLLYCDKAVANEIFDLNAFAKKHRKKTEARVDFSKEDKPIPVSPVTVNSMLTTHEELIARTYKIVNSLDELKSLADNPEKQKLLEIQRTMAADMQTLQTALLLVHEQVMNLSDSEHVSKDHVDFHGFFVYANDMKYLIPSENIIDVVCENTLNYEVEQNQRYYVRQGEEEGDESENIPVYALSSLFPGQKAHAATSLDTILIASYQGQKIGIIVDAVQRFVYLVQKPMPESFRNFPVYLGVSYDEKYNLVPILSVPEILRRFRSLRGYDVKKFEANTSRQVWRLLTVDDSETTLQIERSILNDVNFIVDQAHDGIEALEMVRTNRYDLIITDDAMPRMNGEILLDNVRRMEQYASVPVVALAARPIDSADAFISKADFKRSELIQTVKDLLNE